MSVFGAEISRGWNHTLFALAAATVLGAPSLSDAQQAPQCKAAAALARVPELTEGSGVAASRRTPGRFWALNDSGDPTLLALDARGEVTGRLHLSGAKVDDWEALAVGSCPSGSCIYVGDIGDNGANRKQITIYRVAEPADVNATPQVDLFHASYPDGAHDAESLLVATDGRLYIVTKGSEGPVSIYRFPNEPQEGTTVRLERVGQPREPRRPAGADRVTDGAVSQDNQWAVLRSSRALTFYRAADLLAGNWKEAGRVSLAPLQEPQGEGVTFASNGSVYVVGEGGGKRQPGTFAHLTCALRP